MPRSLAMAATCDGSSPRADSKSQANEPARRCGWRWQMPGLTGRR